MTQPQAQVTIDKMLEARYWGKTAIANSLRTKLLKGGWAYDLEYKAIPNPLAQ